MGGGGRVLLCTQRDQLDCPPPNGLNHYLPLNKTGAHSSGERFRATMAWPSFFIFSWMLHAYICMWRLCEPEDDIIATVE